MQHALGLGQMAEDLRHNRGNPLRQSGPYTNNFDAIAGAMQISYFAAKGGILQVTRALAAELAPFGVLVNAIAPGVFATEMTDGMLDSEGSLVLKNRTCLKRFAEPFELCPQMLLLASEENTYCTGQTIYVDGGLTSQL